MKLQTGINDLATVNPELAAQWHPTLNGDLLPIHVTAGSNKKVWWQCEEGHEWPAKIVDRSRGSGCPYCAGQLPIIGKTDLATINPKLVEQWHPSMNKNLLPTQVTAGSNKIVWWQCVKGHN